MDRDIYQEACPVSPSMVSPRRIARDQTPTTATGTAKDGLKETSGQEDYIPGVGMRSAGQSQLDSQVLPSAMKAMPVLAIILNCCLLGTVIFIAVTVSDLKLSVNKLDQKTLNLQLSVRQINQQAEKCTTGQAVVSTWPRQVTEKAEDLTVTVDDETTMQTVSAATCPDGYMKYREVCYKAFDTYKTFSESAKICRSDGGTLAMPRDAGINAFLYSLTTTLGSNDDFWFGLHDQRQEGKWTWMDDTALGTGNYTAWAADQPNSYKGEEDCALLHTGWYDYPCQEEEGFFCQVIP